MAIGPQDKNPSYIHTSEAATAFVGYDAVKLYQATSVKIGLRVFAKTGHQVNRSYTPTAMIAFATEITGKKYKRNGKQYLEAADDLEIWCNTMKAALPIVKD